MCRTLPTEILPLVAYKDEFDNFIKIQLRLGLNLRLTLNFTKIFQ